MASFNVLRMSINHTYCIFLESDRSINHLHVGGYLQLNSLAEPKKELRSLYRILDNNPRVWLLVKYQNGLHSVLPALYIAKIFGSIGSGSSLYAR